LLEKQSVEVRANTIRVELGCPIPNSRGRISRRLQLDPFVPAVQERGDQRADLVRGVQKDEMPTAFDGV
jgi:hypothetical protein